MGERTYSWIHTLHVGSDSNIWEHEAMVAQMKGEGGSLSSSRRVGNQRDLHEAVDFLILAMARCHILFPWLSGSLGYMTVSTSSGCHEEATVWALGQELSFLPLQSCAIP